MTVGLFLGLKKVLPALAVVVALNLFFLSCGGVTASTPSTSASSSKPSGLAFRALISDPVRPFGAALDPVVDIVDATQDVLSGSWIDLGGETADAGLMAEASNYTSTLVFSPADNKIAVIDNSTEKVASTVTIPGPTESMVVGTGNSTAYAAVPSATVNGQAPGALVALNLSTLSSAAIQATIPIVGARFVITSHNGNHLLVFSDDSQSVTWVAPILIGTASDPRTSACCFDHPVWGVFSGDDSVVYVFNCGPECGGTTASIAVLPVGGAAPTATIPVDAATYGILQNTTLFVAGSPPSADCSGVTTAAQTCGRLDVVDTNAMSVTSLAVIPDGYHDRMAMGENAQLFVGSHTCTNINSQTEVRGCLAIVNTTNSQVVNPPRNGDVTGIQPISNRVMVYVCQGGLLYIYNTLDDKLEAFPAGETSPDIVGQAIDVKQADGPP